MKKKTFLLFLFALLFLFTSNNNIDVIYAYSSSNGNNILGNTSITNFQTAKYILFNEIYKSDLERNTIYCNINFTRNKEVKLSDINFITPTYQNRSSKVEAEHIVPVAEFSKYFLENHSCFTKDGKKIPSRKCADAISIDFKKMECDLHNLYPAIGSVNALRQDYEHTENKIPDYIPYTFGNECKMKIYGNYSEPPELSRGKIARAYLYMASTYPLYYHISHSTRQTMKKWNREYPPDDFEKIRNERIKEIQGNTNPFIEFYDTLK